jgi:hypothetical protein
LFELDPGEIGIQIRVATTSGHKRETAIAERKEFIRALNGLCGRQMSVGAHGRIHERSGKPRGAGE